MKKVFLAFLTLILICLASFLFLYIFTRNGIVNQNAYLLQLFITPIVVTIVLKKCFYLKMNIILLFVLLFIFHVLFYIFCYWYFYQGFYELLHGYPFSVDDTLGDNFNNYSGTPN